MPRVGFKHGSAQDVCLSRCNWLIFINQYTFILCLWRLASYYATHSATTITNVSGKFIVFMTKNVMLKNRLIWVRLFFMAISIRNCFHLELHYLQKILEKLLGYTSVSQPCVFGNPLPSLKFDSKTTLAYLNGPSSMGLSK